MLAPIQPLRMIAQYEHIIFSPDGTMEERKKIIEAALRNCQITETVAQDQMTKVCDPMILEDICEMRRSALLAIPLAEAALKADSLESFNKLSGEFRSRYGTLIGSVKSYLWDASESSKRYLWPLVEEVM